MGVTHVPFERWFDSPSEGELRELDYFSAFGHKNRDSLCWADLDQFRCVVVLGEGKCGKTHEFKQ
jgi:hypothetical protein